MEVERETRNQALSQLVETFRCCVCLGFVRPGQKLRCCTPNGHLVCNACLASMKKLQKRGDKTEVFCPLCRVGKFEESDSFAALKTLFDVAKKFVIYECQGANWGCTARLSASQVLGHEASCTNAPSVCPGDGCNFKAPFRYLSEHNRKPRATSCFTEIRNTGNRSTFFLWKIDVGGQELLDEPLGTFKTREEGFKPSVLCSQDPSVKACLLTSVSPQEEFFFASVVWLQDNCISKARREKRFVEILAQSCHCNGLKFTGEAAFQNWESREIEGKQLKLHCQNFRDLVKKCVACGSENGRVTLQIKLLVPSHR